MLSKIKLSRPIYQIAENKDVDIGFIDETSIYIITDNKKIPINKFKNLELLSRPKL